MRRFQAPYRPRSSPSSRRAWIEILLCPYASSSIRVALLAEGVDRNATACRHWVGMGGSPSSRRAWIEILPLLRLPPAAAVALLAEGVDRNTKGSHDCPGYRVALLAEGVDRNT